ncbi:hypothetical protein SSPS47_03400 [Streptomyces sp. S4.7]|uniref:hypothetical protein n=1 Tax=Streptomyces sp. S4.7 TaxID=2705439 RepID=UPI0013986036|nr:hypothetical protein [Streptomyces sp. S4.7]QHY94175.1 hypothetical protein SSPS47_03400 [Streptomyces sp. S4.7]
MIPAVVVGAGLLLRRHRRGPAAAGGELQALNARLSRNSAESAHLVNITLPTVVERLRDGADTEEALATVPPPSDPQLRCFLRAFADEVGLGERRAAAATAGHEAVVTRLGRIADDLDLLPTVTLPAALGGLREGRGADTVLADLQRPSDPRLRALTEAVVRDFAISERRGGGGHGAPSIEATTTCALGRAVDRPSVQTGVSWPTWCRSGAARRLRFR